MSLVIGTPCSRAIARRADRRAPDRRRRRAGPARAAMASTGISRSRIISALVAIPQHDAIAVGLVDEDHGELVLRVADDDVGRSMPALRSSARTRRPFSSVPGDAGVAGAQAEPRARAHRGRHLAAAENLLPLDFHLGERAEGLRIAGQEVNVVDGVGADADDVPRARQSESSSRPSSGRSITPAMRVRFEGVSKRFGAHTGARRHRSRRRRGRMPGAARAVGLRQDDAAAAAGRARARRRGPHLDRRSRGQRRRSRGRDVAMVFQNYALYPHFTVFENIAFPLRARSVAAGEIDTARARRGGARRPRRAARSPAGAAVRRPAAARRAGSRDRPQSRRCT